MTSDQRVFRLFVSSTFSDMVAERNALQERVFPKLRRFCQEHGARFQAIDLRWGVSVEASADQRTMDICLEELRRCQQVSSRLNFIALLGERYGWRPLPARIEAEEYQALVALLAHEEQAMLGRWYRRDDNAIPPEYRLLPRAGGFDEATLRALFVKALNASRGFSEEAREKYECSATHQEVLLGAWRQPETTGHTFAYLRTFDCLPERADEKAAAYADYLAAGFRDADARVRLEALRDRLAGLLEPGDRLYRYRASYDRWPARQELEKAPSPFGLSEELDASLYSLCDRVERDLRTAIETELASEELVPATERERRLHWEFAREWSHPFVGRQKTLEQIRDYVRGTETGPLVVFGRAGSGKTALLARAALELRDAGQAHTVVRFLDITRTASETTSLLASLCREIADLYEDDRAVPRSLDELIDDFPRRLALATPQRPLVVVLDGLDRTVVGEADSLSWLPGALPDNVKLLASVLNDGAGTRAVREIGRLVPDSRQLSLDSLALDEGGQLLHQWLTEDKRTLRDAQRQAVLEKFASCPLPLYLRLAFEESRRWASWEEAETLPVSISGLVRHLFNRLAQEANHGATFISHGLGYLVAARAGLAEDELLSVLSADGKVMQDFRRRSPESPPVLELPVVVWARLRADLGHYLVERDADGARTLTFYHRQLIEEATACYLADGAVLQDRHGRLGDCFRVDADPGSDRSWAGGGRRGFQELAYHLYREAKASGNPRPLYELVDDRCFRERQFEALGRVEPVIEPLMFAIDLSLSSGDPAAIARYTLQRGHLDLALARAFLYRLVPLAHDNPELARSVAGLVPSPSERLVALALVAWVMAGIAGRRGAACRLLRELGQDEETWLTAWQVPAVLAMTRAMVESDVEDARYLLRRVPDCPLRSIAREVWQNASLPLRSLAAVLAEPVGATVAADEWRHTTHIARYVQAHGDAIGASLSPERFVEDVLHYFGLGAVGAGWTLTAASLLARGLTFQGQFALCRGLYEPHALTPPPVRVWLALKDALVAAGEPDLAAEYRERVTGWFHTLSQFTTDAEARRRAAALVARLDGVAEDRPALWEPAGNEPIRRAAVCGATEEQAPGAHEILERAIQQVVEGRLADAAATLTRVPPEVWRMPMSGDEALPLAGYALAHIVGARGVGDACGRVLVARGLAPACLFAPAEEEDLHRIRVILLRGDAACLEAVALALRLAGRSEVLAMLLRRACSSPARFEAIDACLSQQVRAADPDPTTLRRVNDELNAQDTRTGVASGLGTYYYESPFTGLLWVGVILASLGWAGGAHPGLGALVAGVFALGGLLDLAIWHKIGLWQKPELSRRSFLPEMGSYLSTGIILLLLFAVFRDLFGTRMSGGALCATLVIVSLLGSLLARRGLALRRLSLRTQIAIATGASTVALGGALVSGWLATWIDPAVLRGVFCAGAIYAGWGLNCLIKHIPVRRFYEARGVRLGEEPADRSLAPHEAPATADRGDAPPPDLARSIDAADQALTRSDFLGAQGRYTTLLDDPRAAHLPPERRAALYLNRGFARRRLGRHQEAIEDYREAAALNPASPRPHLNAGLVLAQDLCRYEEGEREFTLSLQRDPAQPGTFSSRGLTRLARGDGTGAQADFQTALLLDPDHSDALSNMGTLEFERGHFDRAAEFFFRALEVNPGDVEVRCNYAMALIRLGAVDAAYHVLRQDPRAWQLCGHRLFGSG
jgi:tetratricopeptide (TPR) repeat protein